MERLFNLDPQLLHDAALLAINVFVLFVILSYLLFEPVRKVLEDRKNKIKQDNDEAEANKLEASKLKEEYQAKLQSADKEADSILADARARAQSNEQRVIASAKEEAALIKEHAYNEAELEKERVKDDVKKEIVSVASAMASKVAAREMTDEDKEKLLDQTLDEIGEETWLN